MTEEIKERTLEIRVNGNDGEISISNEEIKQLGKVLKKSLGLGLIITTGIAVVNTIYKHPEYLERVVDYFTGK